MPDLPAPYAIRGSGIQAYGYSLDSGFGSSRRDGITNHRRNDIFCDIKIIEMSTFPNINNAHEGRPLLQTVSWIFMPCKEIEQEDYRLPFLIEYFSCIIK
jgi:hypothetical protein